MSLNTASRFAILAASTVTSTGGTIVIGDLGLFPGTSVVGFPPGLVINGVQQITNGVAQQGQADLTSAITTLSLLPCGATLTGQDLGGMTLTSGVYCYASSAQLTGTLVLDAENIPGAVFVFKIGSTLTTASGSLVSLINSGSECNVYWVLGSSATIGSTSTFVGNVLASASITLNGGATVGGRLLASTGAVTLINNLVTNSTCTTCPPSLSTPSRWREVLNVGHRFSVSTALGNSVYIPLFFLAILLTLTL